MSDLASTDVLESRAKLASIASWAFIALSAIILVFELAEVFGLINMLALTDGLFALYSFSAIAYLVVFVVSVVLVAMWIHRAHANLHNLGLEGLEFTPGWAVGWYFIPFACLIKPYQAMRELWNTSFGEMDNYGAEAPARVKLWWACWIIGGILGNVSTRIGNAGEGASDPMQIAGLLGAASSILLIICAWNLLGLIREITAGQRDGLGTAEVFA